MVAQCCRSNRIRTRECVLEQVRRRDQHINLKTILSEACYALRYRNYGQIYLTPFAYQFNRRFDLRGLVTGLIVDVARSKRLPERVVRREHAEAAF
jgi:hypothetical protein